MPQHPYMFVSCSTRLLLSEVMGTINREWAIPLLKTKRHLKEDCCWGYHSGERKCYVNTVGVNEDLIQNYIFTKIKRKRNKDKNTNSLSGRKFNNAITFRVAIFL